MVAPGGNKQSKKYQHVLFRRASVPLEDYIETLVFETSEEKDLLEAVLRLPEKYRIAIHLFYYEEYSVKEISEILHTSGSNVKVRLSRGRKLLKTSLQGAWIDNE